MRRQRARQGAKGRKGSEGSVDGEIGREMEGAWIV